MTSTVAFDGTFDGWRTAARGALAAGLAPAHVVWQSADDPQAGLALGASADEGARALPSALPTAGTAGATPTAGVPRRFLAVAALVACHRDPQRWATLYRVLWRLTRGGEPHLLAVAVDPDVLQLTRMAKTIQREVHKMHAFVRFRLVQGADGTDEYIAWFEPEHDVVERAAALFVRRFANMRWAVLTPRTSVRWDGSALAVGPGVPRAEAPSTDALERLWGTYYAHIFNPARVKLQAMRSEMPKRYWRNLPEAPLIAPMVRDAPSRVRLMIEAAATPRRSSAASPAPGPRDAALREADARTSGEPLDRAASAPAAVAPERVGHALVYEGTTEWERADALATGAATLGGLHASGDAERLSHYASRYPMAVVASTRHRVFAPALASLWVDRAPRGLLFDVHAHSAMLGGAVRPHRLPRAIRDRLPASLAGVERVGGELVPDAVRDAIWDRFRAGATVLAQRGALGVVLLTLPPDFAPDRERAAMLRDWLGRLAPWEIGVAFAHPGWASNPLRARTARLLAACGATRVLGAGEASDGGPLAVLRDRAGIERVAHSVERVHVVPAR